MSSFAALMALSATQTRENEAQVKSALVERQRKEAAKRKQQEEKDRKEKEMEARLRLKHLEERQREEERAKRKEAERQAKEAVLKRKEDEQRDALRYGPKRKTDYPSSAHAAQGERRRRSADSDDESGGGGAALTREEKRQQRLQRELNYGIGGGRRSGGVYKKAGRRLPGGAVDVSLTTGADVSGKYRNAKDRIAHEPMGLIKLNVNKRDTRTIDEIRQDIERKKNKVLSGEDAKGFDDWFGQGKAKAKGTPQPQPQATASRASSIFASSRSATPDTGSPAQSAPSHSKAQSRTSSLPSRPPSQPQPSSTYPSSKPPLPKGSGISVRALNKPMERAALNPSSKPKMSFTKTPAKPAATSKAPRPADSSSKYASAAAPRKRQRSLSYSDSPPPKRRSLPPEDSRLGNDISSEIWKLFGKDRNRVMARDVFSDDEDMEADAMDLLDEELESARIARMEDEAALVEERRHEEEKRRKRKEREGRGRM